MHKSQRPFLLMTKSSQHKLARFVNLLNKPVLHHYSQFQVKYFFEVVERIRILKLYNTFLFSFDITKIFTKISLDEVIQVCVDRLYDLEKPTN